MKSTYQVLLFTVLAAILYLLVKTIPSNKPLLTVSDMVRRNGYEIETHYVTTKDGYILEHHRLIPTDILPVSLEDRKVVILNHGIMDKSNMWIAFTKERSLGYYLSERGYDVWMLNSRGNSISRGHVILPDKETKYWNHSWHEIGIHDIPESIDYILKVTHASKVDFVGFSMGATAFFVMMSENSSYSEKVRSMAALGPAAYNVDVTEMFPYVRHLFKAIQVYQNFYINNFGPEEIPGFGCDSNGIWSIISCQIVIACAHRLQYQNLNLTEYGYAIPYLYGSTSGHSLLHYYQNLQSGKFRKFDHGNKINLQLYGSAEPPEYNLKKVTTPMAVFWSDTDDVCPSKGIKQLIDELPNVHSEHIIHNYNHASFFIAQDTENLINDEVYKFLNQPEPISHSMAPCTIPPEMESSHNYSELF